MRKLAAVVLGCLLLTGCAANWQQEVRYKIVSIHQGNPTEYFNLELVGEAPSGALAPEKLKNMIKETATLEGAQIGDEVICVVEQRKRSAIEDSNVVTDLTSCKKA
ncbi:hypothetical protein [Lentzea sp. NBRC 102530]|uniref:hypothetical protein n=1 Tax=Lentzea sp. NBRC 102530 TaxID=3032201 RepID=UPI0024A20E69|nr:hypothetical protein [Lentzea sp. NBRC 102530]GLY48547.1 hypothetical protein Lesp01_22030 [Lentzea sp. NBRC 102530]